MSDVAISWDGQFIEVCLSNSKGNHFYHLTEEDATILRDELTRYLDVMEIKRNRQQPQPDSECPLCGRSKDICDGNCTCPECKGNGFDGYCMDCKVCDGTGIIIAKQPQTDSE